MLYRTMPKSGDRLSILGFGAMRLPLKGSKIDEPRATAQIRTAVDRGVNYIDTAMPYHGGASEPFLGRALSGGYRRKVKIATKLPHWDVRRRADMDMLLNLQLENLRTGTIDYYLLHQLGLADWRRLQELGVVEFMNTAKKDGRVANIGFSFHSGYDEFTAIIESYDWDFCQIQYNYLDEQHQAGTRGLEFAARNGLGVIVMEPLRGGNLARSMPPEVDRIFSEAEVKRSPAEWSLRWIWNRPEVITVLSGMNEESHIEENLSVADEGKPDSLTEKELEIIRRAEKKYRQLMSVACTGCRYCMPCPAGVAIPECFDACNSLLWGNNKEGFFRYLFMAGRPLSGREPGFASRCTECGQCEEKCPQALPVRRHLRDVAKKFEGPKLTIMLRLMKLILFFKRRKNLKKASSIR